MDNFGYQKVCKLKIKIIKCLQKENCEKPIVIQALMDCYVEACVLAGMKEKDFLKLIAVFPKVYKSTKQNFTEKNMIEGQ